MTPLGLTPTRSQKIISLVEQLKSAYEVTGETTMDELAERVGAEVLQSPLPTPKGHSEIIEGTWFIALNPSLSPRDREFTLAHELAHAALGIGKRESTADTCAAELLWERRLARFSKAGTPAGAQGDVW